jgi:plastocyanin
MPFLINSRAKGQRHGRVAFLLACALLNTSYGAHAASKPTVHTVVIEAMQFSPQTIEVDAGDSVKWTNKDAFPHTATSDRRGFNSREIPTNRSWTFVARKKGTFPYSCLLHPTMKGTLVVK